MEISQKIIGIPQTCAFSGNLRNSNFIKTYGSIEASDEIQNWP